MIEHSLPFQHWFDSFRSAFNIFRHRAGADLVAHPFLQINASPRPARSHHSVEG